MAVDYGTTTDLGWMLQNVEQYDEALAIYKAYRLAYPNDPEAPYPEAQYYYLHKQYAKVPPLIEGTLAEKPHPNSFRILAHSYDHLGKLLDSRRVWKLLIATYPHEPAITTSGNEPEAGGGQDREGSNPAVTLSGSETGFRPILNQKHEVYVIGSHQTD